MPLCRDRPQVFVVIHVCTTASHRSKMAGFSTCPQVLPFRTSINTSAFRSDQMYWLVLFKHTLALIPRKPLRTPQAVTTSNRTPKRRRQLTTMYSIPLFPRQGNHFVFTQAMPNTHGYTVIYKNVTTLLATLLSNTMHQTQSFGSFVCRFQWIKMGADDSICTGDIRSADSKRAHQDRTGWNLTHTWCALLDLCLKARYFKFKEKHDSTAGSLVSTTVDRVDMDETLEREWHQFLQQTVFSGLCVLKKKKMNLSWHCL